LLREVEGRRAAISELRIVHAELAHHAHTGCVPREYGDGRRVDGSLRAGAEREETSDRIEVPILQGICQGVEVVVVLLIDCLAGGDQLSRRMLCPRAIGNVLKRYESIEATRSPAS
jgi:hypothetical protein